METKYSKTIVILISLSMTSFADSDSDAKTIYYTSENDGVGNYEYRSKEVVQCAFAVTNDHYTMTMSGTYGLTCYSEHGAFETSNGISRQENGIVENAGQPNAYLRVAGSYFYPAPDGKIVEVRYEADENGFRILPATPSAFVAQVSPQIVASLLG